MSQASGGGAQLPDAIKRQIQIMAYVFSASTAVSAWDLVNHLREEYVVFSNQKLGLATVAYFSSRIASLMYSLGLTIFATYPLPDCDAFIHAFTWFYPLAISGSAFLFFMRVRAIYGGSRLFTFIFGFLWVAVVGTSITIPLSGDGISVGGECVFTNGASWTGISGVLVTVYDTAVFVAISYRLGTNYSYDNAATGIQRLKMIFSGANLPAFSKSLLMDGQMYYMFTIIVNLTATVLVYIPSNIGLLHGLFVVPHVVLTSIMATRVYRNTKLGLVYKRPRLSLPTLSATANGNPSGGIQNVRLPIEFALPRTVQSRTNGGNSTDSLSGSQSRELSTPSKTPTHDGGFALKTFNDSGHASMVTS